MHIISQFFHCSPCLEVGSCGLDSAQKAGGGDQRHLLSPFTGPKLDEVNQILVSYNSIGMCPNFPSFVPVVRRYGARTQWRRKVFWDERTKKIWTPLLWKSLSFRRTPFHGVKRNYFSCKIVLLWQHPLCWRKTPLQISLNNWAFPELVTSVKMSGALWQELGRTSPLPHPAPPLPRRPCPLVKLFLKMCFSIRHQLKWTSISTHCLHCLKEPTSLRRLVVAVPLGG